MAKKKKNSFKKKQEAKYVDNIFNPSTSTWETEAGTFLWIWGQHGLQSEF